MHRIGARRAAAREQRRAAASGHSGGWTRLGPVVLTGRLRGAGTRKPVGLSWQEAPYTPDRTTGPIRTRKGRDAQPPRGQPTATSHFGKGSRHAGSALKTEVSSVSRRQRRRVRGPVKVAAHLTFGLLVIAYRTHRGDRRRRATRGVLQEPHSGIRRRTAMRAGDPACFSLVCLHVRSYRYTRRAAGHSASRGRQPCRSRRRSRRR